MDGTPAQEHLAQAERHIAQAEKTVARQREIVAELRRDGHDTMLAQSLLKEFEELLALHVADRERLRREVAAEGRP